MGIIGLLTFRLDSGLFDNKTRTTSKRKGKVKPSIPRGPEPWLDRSMENLKRKSHENISFTSSDSAAEEK